MEKIRVCLQAGHLRNRLVVPLKNIAIMTHPFCLMSSIISSTFLAKIIFFRPSIFWQRLMDMIMLKKSSKKKIFLSIIIFNSINVMNKLPRLKVPAKFFFHSKSASFNIISVLPRMFRRINKNITSIYSYSTFPFIRFFTKKKFFLMTSKKSCFASSGSKVLPATTSTNFVMNPSFSPNSHANMITHRPTYNKSIHSLT